MRNRHLVLIACAGVVLTSCVPFGGGVPLVPGCGDHNEPNDTAETATEVPVPGILFGTICGDGPPGDIDYLHTSDRGDTHYVLTLTCDNPLFTEGQIEPYCTPLSPVELIGPIEDSLTLLSAIGGNTTVHYTVTVGRA
jgi:hypothetical protein